MIGLYAASETNASPGARPHATQTKEGAVIFALRSRLRGDLSPSLAIAAIVAALLVAVGIRIALLSFVSLPPTVSDAAGYDTAARRLALGESYRFPIGAERPTQSPLHGPAFQAFLRQPPNALVMPGYPEFLSMVYRLSGSGPQRLLAVALVQSVLGVLAVALLALIAWRVGTRLEAVIAAFLAAFYLPFAWINNAVMSETAFTIIALAAIEALRAEKIWLFALMGLLSGAAAYIRPTFSLWPFLVVALVAFWSIRDLGAKPALWHALKWLAVLSVAAAFALSPWIVRNESIYQRVIPLTTNRRQARLRIRSSRTQAPVPA